MNEPADVEVWVLYQWMCHSCGYSEGVPVAYGSAETVKELREEISDHRFLIHHEIEPQKFTISMS